MSETCSNPQRDFLSHRITPWLVWVLPAASIIVTAWVEIDPAARTVIWTGSLVVMGVACLLNARRCGRLHCHITAPFFLLLALAVLLHGTGLVSLGPGGWNTLGIIFLVGAVVLIFVPEWIWGKYRRNA